MRPTAFLVTLCAVFVVAAEARACSVPVFRYALERWKPASYPAYVFHRGPLTQAEKAAVEKLESPANVKLTLVDLDEQNDPAVVALHEKHGKGQALPFVVVQYPDADEAQPPAFTGKLDKALAVLLDSPARRQIVRLLTSGDSAVWVLLTSGDRKADDDAAKLLDRELTRLQKEITLPEQPQEGSMLLTELPLKVSFPIVRVDRSKPEEAAFVRMLLASDEDLDRAKGPIVVPIFGRGRALVALEGSSLSAKEIERSAKFLCGACSCRVKELNPGTDLLVSANWEELLDAEPVKAEPKTSAAVVPPDHATKESDAPKDAPTIPSGYAPKTDEKSVMEEAAAPRTCHCRTFLYSAVGGAGMLVLACGAWVIFARRSRS